LRRIRTFVAASILVAVLAGIGASTLQRVPLPSHGLPRIGAVYAASFVCPLAFQIGETWWAFTPGTPWPQEMEIGGVRYMPFDVHGTLIFTSPDKGIFVADSDGSRLELERLDGPRWPTSAACI